MLNKKRCWQINETNQTKWKIAQWDYCLNMHDNVWWLRLFMREFLLAAMLNPSLKSCFLQEFSRFSRILGGLVE